MPDATDNVKSLLEDLLKLQATLSNKIDKKKLGVIINAMLSGKISLKSVLKMVQKQLDDTKDPNAKNPTRRSIQTLTWQMVADIFKEHLDIAKGI